MCASACCKNYQGQKCVTPCVMSAVTIFALGVITMFVLGILGAVDTLSIPPMGVQIMIGVSTFFILSALSYLCLAGRMC
jgi:hypothetical protein